MGVHLRQYLHDIQCEIKLVFGKYEKAKYEVWLYGSVRYSFVTTIHSEEESIELLKQWMKDNSIDYGGFFIYKTQYGKTNKIFTNVLPKVKKIGAYEAEFIRDNFYSLSCKQMEDQLGISDKTIYDFRRKIAALKTKRIRN